MNDLRDFMRAHSLFVLWYPLTKTSQKKAENNVLFDVNVLFLSFVAVYDFKVVKSIKIEQNLFKNGQSHDAKNNRSEQFVSQ